MKRFLALIVLTIGPSGCECGVVDYSCDRGTSRLEVHGKITLRGEPVSGAEIWLSGAVEEESPRPRLYFVTSSTGNYRVWATYRAGACDFGFGLSITLPDPTRESVRIDLGKGCKDRTVDYDFK